MRAFSLVRRVLSSLQEVASPAACESDVRSCCTSCSSACAFVGYAYAVHRRTETGVPFALGFIFLEVLQERGDANGCVRKLLFPLRKRFLQRADGAVAGVDFALCGFQLCKDGLHLAFCRLGLL